MRVLQHQAHQYCYNILFCLHPLLCEDQRSLVTKQKLTMGFFFFSVTKHSRNINK